MSRNHLHINDDDGPYSAWTKLLLFIMFVSVTLVLGSCFVNLITKPAQVADVVTDTNRMIHNYEQFNRDVEDIKAIKVKIQTNQQSLDEFVTFLGEREPSFQEGEQLKQMRNILSGLRSQQANVAAEYNAKSESATINFVKENRLPSRYEYSDATGFWEPVNDY